MYDTAHQCAGGNHDHDEHDGAEAVLVEHLNKLGQGSDSGRIELEGHKASRCWKAFMLAS